ncbi:MAG: hypothetical protein N2Z80_07750 [Hydrogenothermaceae bacterium]|nr:hypothetical protein [Hydrogenothermaceae bacterium]
MGNIYKVVFKDIKKRLTTKFKDLNFLEETFPEGSLNLYFDVGYGEKFVIFFLPIDREFNPNLLIHFAPLEVFFESVRRFLEIKPPVGYRVRFFLSSGGFKNLLDHLEKLGRYRVLLVVNLEETGIGNEKIVINGLSGNILYKIDKILNNQGLSTRKINIKEENHLEDRIMSTMQFRSIPNKYKNILPKDLYEVKRRDYIVLLIFLIITSVFKL